MPYRNASGPVALRIAGAATLSLLFSACSPSSDRAKPPDVEEDAIDFGAKAPPRPQDDEATESKARFD